MSIDLIKKEDTYLIHNNLILTHYEILGDNDIYFLKIRIKNNGKKINSFKINFNVDGKNNSYDINIPFDENEEKDILDPINIDAADFEFLSFSNLKYDEDIKDEIINEDIKDTNNTNNKNIKIAVLISSIFTLFVILFRIIYPYINTLSTDYSEVIYEVYGNLNVFKFIGDKRFVYHDDYKYIYIIKLIILFVLMLISLLYAVKNLILINKDDLKEKDIKFPIVISTLLYLLTNTSNYSFDNIIITLLGMISFIIIDIFIKRISLSSHQLIKKISKEVLIILSFIMILLLKQNIIDNLDIYQLFYKTYSKYDKGLQVLTLFVVIINLILMIYVSLSLIYIITEKVDPFEYIILILLSFVYFFTALMLKTNKDYNDINISTFIIIIVTLLMIIVLIIKELLIKHTINRSLKVYE